MIDPTLPLLICLVENEALRKNLACVATERDEAVQRELFARECMRDAMANRDELVRGLYGERGRREIWLSPGGTS